MTTPPLASVPDDKDWTWTIEAACPDCGFDATSVQRDDVPRLVPAYTLPLLDALTSPDARVRPQPAVWSALEYGAHPTVRSSPSTRSRATSSTTWLTTPTT